jgi:hypothetical protein
VTLCSRNLHLPCCISKAGKTTDHGMIPQCCADGWPEGVKETPWEALRVQKQLSVILSFKGHFKKTPGDFFLCPVSQ